MDPKQSIHPSHSVRLEIFEGNKKLLPLRFFVYEPQLVYAQDHAGRKLSVHNAAVRHLNADCETKGYCASTDKELIYTTREVDPVDLSYSSDKGKDRYSVSLRPCGQREIPFSTPVPYEKLLCFLLEKNLLEQSGKGYRTENEELYCDSLITVDNPNNPQTIRSANDHPDGQSWQDAMQVRLHIVFRPHVLSDGSVFLYIDDDTKFDTCHTLYSVYKNNPTLLQQYIDQKISVRSILPTYRMYGRLCAPPQDAGGNQAFGLSHEKILHYLQRYDRAWIKRFCKKDPPDDPVLCVESKTGGNLSYLAGSLKRVMTIPQMRVDYPKFSGTALRISKRSMKVRYAQDKKTLADIGIMTNFQELAFSPEPVMPEKLGFEVKQLTPPALVIGGGRQATKKNEALYRPNGYYRKPDTAKDHRFHVVVLMHRKAITNGWHKKILEYLRDKGGMGNSFSPGEIVLDEAIPLPETIDTLSCKEMAMTLRKTYPMAQVALCVVPDGDRGDTVYDASKRAFVQMETPLPSQMLAIGHARKFFTKFNGRWIASDDQRYLAQNLCMGIMAKAGGIPCALKSMPGDVDLFVGIDVGMQEKGIHYPSCGTAFLGNGAFLGFYQVAQAIRGEKINVNALQEMFDNILLAYKERTGRYPKCIMIHRDGFSHEQDSWYKEYFGRLGIGYSIYEVIKSRAPHLLIQQGQKISNPFSGTALIHKGKGMAYLVSTAPYAGAPDPVKIVRTCGSIDLDTAVQQIYALTTIYPGSAQNTRLPITTYIADAVCKARGYVPVGRLCTTLDFV